MTTEPPARQGAAFARAALAGNPSDGYGGAVLALTLPGRRATAQAVPARAPTVDPPSELVTATISRFASEYAPAADATAVSWKTTIPRAVGLGGSSAIVVAVLRALGSLWSVTLEPLAMAELALRIEVDDLGIAAGLQDRIAQTHDGLTFMDFGAAGPTTVQPLDPRRLPPLLIAWRPETAGHSGDVHAPLRDRHANGDPVVLDAMRALTRAAHDAKRALHAGDHAALCVSVDASFDARRSMLALDPRHVEMIEGARAAGAAANYAGSGGAIVAVCRDAEHRRHVQHALHELRCGTLTA